MWNAETEYEDRQAERTSVSGSFGLRARSRHRLLLLDDDGEFAVQLARVMEEELDVLVDPVGTPAEAAARLEEGEYEAIILDWNRSGVRGLQRLQVARYLESDPSADWGRRHVPVVLMAFEARETFDFSDTEHFRLVGYVSKRQSFRGIVEDLGQELRNLLISDLSA